MVLGLDSATVQRMRVLCMFSGASSQCLSLLKRATAADLSLQMESANTI